MTAPGSRVDENARSGPSADGAANLIPNASFAAWKGQVSVPATERFTEAPAGWYVDFPSTPRPRAARVSLAKPADLGLGPDQYALHVLVEGDPESHARLVVPIGARLEAGTPYQFSCSLRRPLGSDHAGLTCSDIFLGLLDHRGIWQGASIRRNVQPRGTVRLTGLSLQLDPEALADLSPQSQFALVFDFRGEGEILLAAPFLGLPRTSGASASRPRGGFEDDNIRSQIGSLKLSPIWDPARLAVPALEADIPPRPATVRPRATAVSPFPFVQIVVPVFNAAADVSDLLGSILAHTEGAYEVILADDGSGDFTASRIRHWLAQDGRVRAFSQPGNAGYTVNVNQALQATVAEFVVLLNSDAVVSPGWLDKMLTPVLGDSRAAAIGPVSNAASWQSVPLAKAADGSWAVNRLPPGMSVAAMAREVERASSTAFPEFPLLNGFCTLFRRAALEEVGWLDESAFPRGYGEENDLCLRLRRSGWRLRVADNAYVFHKKSRSFGHATRNDLSRSSGAVLRAKHPEVNLAALEEEMRANPALGELRRRLVKRLAIETTVRRAAPARAGAP